MRPTVTEQLDGMCRILEQDVAPEIASGHAVETLRSVVSNLRMLSKNWAQLLPFLQWDNHVTSALLVTARATVGAELRARIDAALAAAPADAADGVAADACNTQLRALLSACLADACTPDLRASIAEHLAARSARYPMRITGATPKHDG